MDAEEIIIKQLAVETMHDLNKYFTKGKNLDEEKTLSGKKFWEIQEKAWARVKANIK